ncbi:MAG: T9SS type A sorting domain-containing protein [Prolixibacteraceae bacterium]|jgi:hypothetical protein|nr:T9SS type A sorting domain-containing protein [Prolixibacteraceae bacterium]
MRNTLLFLAFLFLAITSYGQHISEYYTFKDTNQGSYGNSNSNSILTGLDSDDGEATIGIGFDFEFAGTVYDELTIGVNGAITFTGTDVVNNNQLDGTATNVCDMIAPLWDDMYQRIADEGLIQCKVFGSEPNRYLVIEWRVSWWGEGSKVRFKMYLYETTNDITFYYRSVDVEETGNGIGASIGLSAGTSGDNFISVTPGNPATISTSTANNSIMPSEYNNYTSFHKYEFKYGPHNDACEDAIVINPNGYSNTQIMNGTDNNDGFIRTDYDDAMNDGVWYTFTADYDGEVTIDITTDDFNVELGVFTGTCGSFSCINSSYSGNGIESVTINVEDGVQYWINAGSYHRSEDIQETGNLTINVNYTPPANDLCANATEITCGDVLEGTNIGATSSGATSCGVESSEKGVWYHFAPSNGGGVTAFWTTADFDTKLTIYEGNCGSLSCIANNDDFGGSSQPYIEIETLPATDYYIYVMGYGANAGSFNLNVACTTPINDEASGAIDVTVNPSTTTCTSPTIIYNNNGATSSESINGIPSCGGYQGGDLWYKFEAPTSGSIKIIRPNRGTWEAMGYAIYSTPESNSPLACSVLNGTNELVESAPITGLAKNKTYWLRFWEYNNNNFGSVGICLQEVDGIYDDINIKNTIISNEESTCFDAENTITVAGNGSIVEFKNGSSVNLIAGTSITLLPGFHAFEGSYVDAHITTNGTFCESLPLNILVAEPVAEKSVEGIFEQEEKEDQIINQPSLKVYPNPNNGHFTVHLENIETAAQVMIFNSIGSLVHQSITNEKITNINLTNIQSGIYFIRINSNNNQFTQKVIIQ